MSSSPNADVVPARPRLGARGEPGWVGLARALVRDRHYQLLGAITLFGGILRFATLGARSYWADEAETVYLVRQSLRGAFSDALNVESNPPLYFVLTWLWSRLLGTGEVAMRSLPALAGTATILVAYGVAAKLVSRRAGLIAALLTSVSPLVVWHAQDARPYAFLIFFSGLSLLCFVHLLDDPRPGMLAWWALASALALSTTYFGSFPVIAEAAWLLWKARAERRRRRSTVLAVSGVAAVGAALAPFALEQRSNASWIATQSFQVRLVEIPAQFLVGHQPPLQRTSALVVGLLVLIAIWQLLTRASPAERRGAGVAALIGGAALAGPILLALGGLDGVLTRTVTAAWIPLAVVVASGFAAERAGRVGLLSLGLVCAISLAIVVSTARAPKFEREDWRGAARAIGPVTDRAIVVSPWGGRRVLLLYRPAARELVTHESVTDANSRAQQWPHDTAAVREIVLIAFGAKFRKIGHSPRPPRPASVAAPAKGFEEVQRIDARYFTLIRFRSRTPAVVGRGLVARHLGPESAALLFEGVRGG
jgi:hypothetical protein